MSKQADHHEPLLTDMVCSLSTFLVSGGMAAFVFASRLPLTAYLFAHVGCAAVAVLVAMRSGHTPRRQALLHAMMATAMGPAGSAGCFLCCVLELGFRPQARAFSEWFASIFPEEEADGQDAFLELLRTSEDPLSNSLRITSFRDTMATGSIEQKQALLGLIARRFSPPFAPALHQALQDPVPAIRVQAASAAASIEARYAEHTYELSQRAARSGGKREDVLALAEHLVEFAESGIAEASRTEEARKAALSSYNQLLATHPNDSLALITSSRLLLHFGEAAEAAKRIRLATQLTGTTAEVASLHMQALFQLNRFDDVRKMARHWLSVSQGSDRDAQRLRAALRLWSGDSPRVA